MNAGWPDDLPQRYVFVVTYGRSGSTLVQHLLNRLPGYVIRGENELVVQPLALAWRQIAHSTELRKRRRLGKTDTRDPWFGAAAIDPDGFGRTLAQNFIREVLKPPAGTEAAGFKEIRWHLKPDNFWVTLNFLKEFFPHARFIFNTRDKGSVAQSAWWAERNAEAVHAELVAAEGLFDRWRTAYPEHCIALHYDDYLTAAQPFLDLFSFLNVPYDAALVADVMADRLDHLARG